MAVNADLHKKFNETKSVTSSFVKGLQTALDSRVGLIVMVILCAVGMALCGAGGWAFHSHAIGNTASIPMMGVGGGLMLISIAAIIYRLASYIQKRKEGQKVSDEEANFMARVASMQDWPPQYRQIGMGLKPLQFCVIPTENDKVMFIIAQNKSMSRLPLHKNDSQAQIQALTDSGMVYLKFSS